MIIGPLQELFGYLRILKSKLTFRFLYIHLDFVKVTYTICDTNFLLSKSSFRQVLKTE